MRTAHAFATALSATVLGLCSLSASADGFVNAGFETGDSSGWTTGSGWRGEVGNFDLEPRAFMPGNYLYDPYLNNSAVVGRGIAEHTDGQLNEVYSGRHAFRAEDGNYGANASVVAQRVDNYTASSIFFAWAAVLDGVHSPVAAASFVYTLRDETLGGVELVRRIFNAANVGGAVDPRFTRSSDDYYYTSWQVEEIAIDAELRGHDFSLELLAADCSLTTHSGVVYLDGFGAAPPLPVPEPETYALMLLGLAAVGTAHRRRI